MSPRRGRAYLRHVTRFLLDEVGEEEREALGVAVHTGYWHPKFSSAAVGVDQLRPWVVPLEHDWGWVRPLWRKGLGQELARRRPVTLAVGEVGEVGVKPGDAPACVGVRSEAAWRPMLDARLLGPVELRVDGRLITELEGHLSGSVLRYVLTRSRRTAHRDELIDLFWPEADPQRARNRLQVAVSALRKAIREVTDVELIEFRDGFYRISPQFDVVTDYEHFERLASQAKAAAAVKDQRQVLSSGQAAIGRYRGRLCADTPYAEWAIFTRERLHMLYGDVLDVLVETQWSTGDYEGCIETAHRMLEDDPCREDVHRLVMRCQSALGRHHQALRQYESCRRILGTTLSVAPSAATAATHRRIRLQLEGYDGD